MQRIFTPSWRSFIIYTQLRGLLVIPRSFLRSLFACKAHQHAQVIDDLENTGDDEGDAKHAIPGQDTRQQRTQTLGGRLDHIDRAHNCGALV